MELKSKIGYGTGVNARTTATVLLPRVLEIKLSIPGVRSRAVLQYLKQREVVTNFGSPWLVDWRIIL